MRLYTEWAIASRFAMAIFKESEPYTYPKHGRFPMKRTDKAPVFTVASVLAHLMSEIALTDDAQPMHPIARARQSVTEQTIGEGSHSGRAQARTRHEELNRQ